MWSSASPLFFLLQQAAPPSPPPFHLLVGALLSVQDSNPEGLNLLYPTPWTFLLNHFLLPLEPQTGSLFPQHLNQLPVAGLQGPSMA